MKLILLRHGDRDSGFGDVPLSAEGEAQAQRLASDPVLLRAEAIFSSPRERTQQTVAPLSETLNIEVSIEPDLDQRKSIESPGEFSRRVLNFIENLPKKYANKTVLLCSHSDWLQTAVLQLPTDSTDMAIHCFFGCAEYKLLKDEQGLWEVL
jgi:broad specificity phosphatase PhoE